MKKWWQDWALIDILVLGIGVLLTWSFINYRNLYPTDNSAILDLWPNVATDIIGVWLSVRLIDALIQSRERHHHVRRELVSNLNYINEQIQKLLPNIYDFNVITLKNELKYATERLPKRRRYLTKSEHLGIEDTLVKLQELIRLADSIAQMRHQCENIRRNFSLRIDNVNESRTVVRELLLEIKHNESNSKLTQIAAMLSQVLAQNSHAFSTPELQQIQVFHQELTSPNRETIDHAPQRTRFNIDEIYEYKIKWLAKVEEKYKELRDSKDPDYRGLSDVLSSAEAELNKNGLPEELSSLSREYFTAINALAAQYKTIQSAVLDIEKKIDMVRLDILEESSFD